MCHPASLLCLSPKMSSLAEDKAELSEAAAHLAETSAPCNYWKQTPSSHLPSLQRHMQHALQSPQS